MCDICFNTLNLEITWIYLMIQFVPRTKHSISVIKTDQFMLYREIIAVCSEIHTEYVNTRADRT